MILTLILCTLFFAAVMVCCTAVICGWLQRLEQATNGEPLPANPYEWRADQPKPRRKLVIWPRLES